MQHVCYSEGDIHVPCRVRACWHGFSSLLVDLFIVGY